MTNLFQKPLKKTSRLPKFGFPNKENSAKPYRNNMPQFGSLASKLQMRSMTLESQIHCCRTNSCIAKKLATHSRSGRVHPLIHLSKSTLKHHWQPTRSRLKYSPKRVGTKIVPEPRKHTTVLFGVNATKHIIQTFFSRILNLSCCVAPNPLTPNPICESSESSSPVPTRSVKTNGQQTATNHVNCGNRHVEFLLELIRCDYPRGYDMSGGLLPAMTTRRYRNGGQ